MQTDIIQGPRSKVLARDDLNWDKTFVKIGFYYLQNELQITGVTFDQSSLQCYKHPFINFVRDKKVNMSK